MRQLRHFFVCQITARYYHTVNSVCSLENFPSGKFSGVGALFFNKKLHIIPTQSSTAAFLLKIGAITSGGNFAFLS